MSKKAEEPVPNDQINKEVKPDQVSLFKSLKNIRMEKQTKVILFVVLVVSGLIFFSMAKMSSRLATVEKRWATPVVVEPVAEPSAIVEEVVVTEPVATPTKAKKKVVTPSVGVAVTLPVTE